MVITPDGGTLIAAQTYTRRLLAFTRAPDGRLSDQRLYAETGDAYPDGIALDAEGCVWCASPFTNEFVRIAPGGDCIMRVVPPTGTAIACMLGGNDRRTLFLMTTDPSNMPAPGTNDPSVVTTRPKPSSDEVLTGGGVFAMTVDVPGAGWP
jgi:sugar lactone lactonase YvrE